MQDLQQVRKGQCIVPQVFKNGTATSFVIDTAGIDYLNVDVAIGFTDVALTTLKIVESDVRASATSLTSPVDVTGLVYGATGAPSLPAATDGNKIFSFEINTQGRRRYLQLVATAANNTTGCAISGQFTAALPSNFSYSNADKGVAGVLNL